MGSLLGVVPAAAALCLDPFGVVFIWGCPLCPLTCWVWVGDTKKGGCYAPFLILRLMVRLYIFCGHSHSRTIFDSGRTPLEPSPWCQG